MRIQAKKITENKVVINFWSPLERGAGYETDVKLTKSGDGWVARTSFDGMPEQESPEQAIDRIGDYMKAIARAMKGRNIKHLNIESLFSPIHKSR